MQILQAPLPRAWWNALVLEVWIVRNEVDQWHGKRHQATGAGLLLVGSQTRALVQEEAIFERDTIFLNQESFDQEPRSPLMMVFMILDPRFI